MSTTEHLPDAISAASLVLAVLAALYTLWLPAVSAALAITPADDKEDRGPQRAQVVTALFTKALPLAGATLAATLILLPRGIAIVVEAWMRWREWGFDDVKGFFVLTLSLMLLLALVSSMQLIGLLKKRKEIGPKP
ncbi:hypothetical protein [Novosphingobium nitrogenifigens]|uniref:hypothetical protein n=1 Tax=Novosphingobium nitrogenifigens TaxID=378548 RepID=UPI00035FEF86|nr:hypothetical protein [Novosphingobium nitrogenifigens]